MRIRNPSTCPVARALAVVGEKWSLQILRDLLLDGPRRFQALQETIDGIPASTLSARLKSLMANGVITRRFYSDHPPRTEYMLTEKGRALGPVIEGLRDWGRRY